jgi:hypothetical protein
MTEVSADLKRNWRRNWLVALLSLSDFALQKERWLNKDITNPAWTYIEFMASYFDDLPFGESYRFFLENAVISQAEYDCIIDFHGALDQYKEPRGDHYDHESILEDGQWQQVVAKGAVAMKRLEALIVDEQEKEIFSKKLYTPPLTAGDFTWPDNFKQPN